MTGYVIVGKDALLSLIKLGLGFILFFGVLSAGLPRTAMLIISLDHAGELKYVT